MILYWEKMQERIKEIILYKIMYAQTINDHTKYDETQQKWVQGRQYLIIGCGFDIETSMINTLGYEATYCYHWQFSLDEWTFGGRSLESLSLFLSYLTNVLRRVKGYLLCLDANLGYEFQFCKRVWAQFGMSNLFAKERRAPLKLDIADCIEMREVLGLFGNSLAQVAKDYTVTQKLVGDLDYSLVRLSNTKLTYKEQQYCENDVQILSELGQYIFKHYFGKNPSLPMTKTGIIRQKVKKKMGGNLKSERERIQSNLPDEDMYFFFRKYLFKGGLCGTNALYMNRVLKNVVCADYTSDYPACMNHYRFPDGKLTEIEPNEFMEERNLPYICVMEFHNLKSKSPHSFLSLHKALDYDPKAQERYVIDNGRIHYADCITFCINDVEFRAICQAYSFDASSTIKRAWCFERYTALPSYLLDVLNEEYLVKEKLKKEGKDGTIEYKDSKSVVNGTYGMTVTSLFMEDLEIHGDTIEPKMDADGNPLKKSYKEAIKSVFLNPFWGFWITSYARSLLMNIITMFPKCIIQYDTDSVYYLKDHPDAPALEQFILEYNNEIFDMNNLMFKYNPHYRDLGAWEVKKPYKRFKGLGSKRYIYEKQDGTIDTVVAGCRKGTIEAQWKHEVKKGYKGDIFDFFQNDMVVTTEFSKKLASKYVDDYDGAKSLLVDYQDYLGNWEKIYLDSCILLVPIEFNMGLDPKHIDFFRTLQTIYNNTPNYHPINDLIRSILYGEN